LPAKELGCGSASTCWRRLDEWAKAGVFEQLQALLLDELGEAGRVDLERVSVDSFSLRASKGDLTGANPVDRGKAGSKLHLAGDAGGLPLSVVVSAANANDSTMLEAVLDDIPAIRMPSGRRRHRWTIERTGAWLGGWRRLRIRYERGSERFYALAMLACSVICFNTLQQPP
jgi:transposase